MTDKEIKALIKAVKDKHYSNDKSDHAVYGASGSERWVNCHGSVALSLTVGPRQAGDSALEGSLAHLCLDLFTKLTEAGLGPLDARKRLLKHFAPTIVADTFEVYQHFVRETPPGAIRLSEQKVDASHFTKEGQWGTVDCTIVEEFGRLKVKDFKYGFQAVEVKGNLQMIYYALAISKRYDHNFYDVELEINQPRANHPDGPIRKHVMTMKDLLRHEKIFRTAVKKCDGPNPSFNAGDWCKWCDAKPVCPEIGRNKAREAGIDFDEITEETASDLDAAPFKDLDKRLPKLLVTFPLIEEYIAAVREYAFKKLDKGLKVEGWKLADKRGVRQYKDERATAREAQKSWGPLAFSPPSLLPPAQLEKVLSVEYDPKTIKKWVAKRVTMKSSGLTMVPESDSRPARSGSDDFGEIAEEGKKRK